MPEQTKVLSLTAIAEQATAEGAPVNVQQVRVLADAGVIDSFKAENGRRYCPPHAVGQVKAVLPTSEGGGGGR